jgi:hypothetical protein
MLLSVLLLATTNSVGHEDVARYWLAPSNQPGLVFTGRWDFSNPSVPWCEWQGASVSLNFDGTGVGMTLDPGMSSEWYRVVVDGDYFNSTKIEIDPGGISSPVLVQGLNPGAHRIEVIKETYVGDATKFYGFYGFGGSGPLNPGPRPTHRIEFYGDSNLAGYSLEHESNQWGSQYQGSTNTYAGIASRRLDAEYHNISASGETISSLHNRYDRLSWWTPNPKWDFSRFTPELVVVNLGANDVGRSEAFIRASYHSFLDDLRSTHPNAHIVLFNGWGWDYAEPANYIADVVSSRNDSNMSAAVFPWLFEQWHGCESDHAGMADYLVDHVRLVLGWPVVEGEIASSYGRGGGVANGSFEGRAPFGGFGWRYGAHDSGVQRLHAPAIAKHGDFFVLLQNGASIQQPNPALPSQTASVTLWLRGEFGGESATVTLDFRNQKMWTNPLRAQSWTVPLTTQWAAHSFSLSAPTGGSRPVFHTRLTIAGDSQARIGVDAVQMAVQ